LPSEADAHANRRRHLEAEEVAIFFRFTGPVPVLRILTGPGEVLDAGPVIG
jgi:hypothetical protein